VVFIPDCHALLNDLLGVIWRALLFAFHDKPDLCDELGPLVTKPDLVKFIKRQADNTLCFVVDQRNALDSDGSTEWMAVEKADAFQVINKLRAFHRYIFSASANQMSDRERHIKQSGINTVESYRGLGEVCTHLFNYLVSCSPGGSSVLVHSLRRLITHAYRGRPNIH